MSIFSKNTDTLDVIDNG